VVRSIAFERFAGLCAFAAAAVGLLYSISFVVELAESSDATRYLKSLSLLAGGLLSAAVLVAVYERLRRDEPGFALLALILGVAAALGSSVHGAEDLAKVARPEDVFNTGLSGIDPRGFLTFGVAGLAFLLVGLLVQRSRVFPERLGQLSYLAGALLVLVYLGRLSIFDPENPVLLLAAALAGFIVTPGLYAWLGVVLREGPASAPPPRA
jgi:hypothetical protein